MSHLVLSIDLDFFVDSIAIWRPDSDRLDDGYTATPASEVMAFVQSRCHLSPSKPTSGQAIVHHDEAFCWIKRWIADGRLNTPFQLAHIDAHSDLGLGDTSYQFILCELLHRPVEERGEQLREGEPDGLSFGNWLAFCIANRWIESILFPRHPARPEDQRSDFPRAYFDEGNVESGLIRLRPYHGDITSFQHEVVYNYPGRLPELPTNEPAVPLRIVSRESFYLDRAPDFVLICQSPGYTPRESDLAYQALQALIEPCP